MKRSVCKISIITFFLFFSCEKDKDKQRLELSKISNKTVSVCDTEHVKLTANGTDGNSLTIIIASNPGFLYLTNHSQTGNTATAILVIEPESYMKGHYEATIQVSDEKGGIDSVNFIINVTEPSLIESEYLQIASGQKWKYQVEFPQNCEVPYNPWFENSGLQATSFTNGMGSWDKGNINFEMLVNNVYKCDSNSIIWDISLSSLGHKFYYYISPLDSIQLQLYVINDSHARLYLFGVYGTLKLARNLVDIFLNTTSKKYTINVPAGEFSNCIQDIVNIEGDGMYVPTGTYPIETYLAPNVGIIKAVGKDSNGNVLYTLELTEFSN